MRQLDFFHEEDKFYIILEYLDGGELFNRIIEKTCFNEKEARDCILHILKALKYCHDQNIVHRWIINFKLFTKSFFFTI